MTAVAIIQARMGSTRLPNKVLADVGGLPILGWIVRAARAVPGIDRVAVATSTETGDTPIAEWCKAEGVACHRGPEDDVLARIRIAARAERADVVMRLTADCPLLDPAVCAQVLALLQRSGCAYASNVMPATFPDGLDCEVFTADALYAADKAATLASDREHVTPYIRARQAEFPACSIVCPLPGLGGERWTVDDAADLAFIKAVAAELPAGRPPSFMDVLTALDRHPEMREINSGAGRNAGYTKSQAADPQAGKPSFARTMALLERAEKVIPLGSQTFSKSRIQYPLGAGPLFLSHGQGGRVWDVDGNEFVDLVSGLLPVVLGYADPDVDAAIRDQLSRGISFSLATALEMELAERLVEIIPCAEMVRFGKNGSDATSAAIRLARAYTGRDRVATCGYHGWQDWYIGATTRNKGVPKAVRELTHALPYNDLAAVERLLETHKGEVAALIMEPMNVEEPGAGYLADLKTLLHRHGTLLVFDEVITGFRYSLGGAQALFGVTPDLAAFGKGMGNGMPVSAVVGRADVMREMEEVFFSGTFGGEALSLAAAITVIDKIKRENVIERLWQNGERLAAEVGGAIKRHGLEGVMGLVGLPPWMIVKITAQPTARREAINTRFLIEMLERGVLILGSHNICFAHDEADIAKVLVAYDGALGRIAEELATGQLEARLPCPTIEPVFRLRG